MNKKTNQSIFKQVLIMVMSTLIAAVILSFFLWFKNLLNNPIKLYWLVIPCIVSILFLIFYILLAFKYNKLQKEISGKTNKCISINNLSLKSKQLLNKHINKANTIAMSYGLNTDVIEELKNLNIIEQYDKVNHKLNYWFFECLSKNPNLLEE